MHLIAAVDRNWAIGKKGKLLVSIPDDMKFFRETTKGHVVVMGRKTLESFPNGLPLKNRTNIVLTSDGSYDGHGAIVVCSEEELKRELTKFDSDDIYVIGGGTIYNMLLDDCNEAHITYIDYAYDADTYFPNLEKNENWVLAEESEEQTYYDLEFYFRRYIKK